MEVAFVKHDLRNISAFGENGIGADMPELQCKMHVENYTFCCVFALGAWSLPTWSLAGCTRPTVYCCGSTACLACLAMYKDPFLVVPGAGSASSGGTAEAAAEVTPAAPAAPAAAAGSPIASFALKTWHKDKRQNEDVAPEGLGV